jgi:hypothetical protein
VHAGDNVEICFRSWVLSTESGVELGLEPASPFFMTLWQKGGLLGLLPS